jgi:hypothetical protein
VAEKEPSVSSKAKRDKQVGGERERERDSEHLAAMKYKEASKQVRYHPQ